MTHTPGPWHRYGDGSGIAGPDGQPIAVVAREGATWESNACLMTASPRLLAAANKLWNVDSSDSETRKREIVDVWAELIDAIEQAEGRQPESPDALWARFEGE